MGVLTRDLRYALTAARRKTRALSQRDAFGAHTYERTDRPGFVHSEW